MDNNINNELPPVYSPEIPVSNSQPSTEIINQPPLDSGPKVKAEIAGNTVPASMPVSDVPAVQPMQAIAPIIAPDDNQQQISSAGLPQIADDNDLIEKEWIVKAKEIVAKTREDPSQQNIGIQHLKADYVKKRFNKDIKLRD